MRVDRIALRRFQARPEHVATGFQAWSEAIESGFRARQKLTVNASIKPRNVSGTS